MSLTALLTRILLPLVAVLLLWGFIRHQNVRIEDLQTLVDQKTAALALADGKITAQNEAIEQLKAEGKEQQDTINGLADEAQRNAGKVEVQWKTKYVPKLVPAACDAAVAAGAENAASIARIFMGATP